jgi:hypothetical protein
MKHIISGIFYGIITLGCYGFACNLSGSNFDDPKLTLLFAGLIFMVGFFGGVVDCEKKLKKKAEEEKARQLEEKRKREQDETNRLMQEFIRKKIHLP